MDCSLTLQLPAVLLATQGEIEAEILSVTSVPWPVSTCVSAGCTRTSSVEPATDGSQIIKALWLARAGVAPLLLQLAAHSISNDVTTCCSALLARPACTCER